jgi:hypothetical protein
VGLRQKGCEDGRWQEIARGSSQNSFSISHVEPSVSTAIELDSCLSLQIFRQNIATGDGNQIYYNTKHINIYGA